MSIKISTHTAEKIQPKQGDKKSFLNREIELFGNKMTDKKKERFYSDLKTLITAGVDLKSALEIIIEEQAKEKDKNFFQGIYDAILKGKSLSDALKDTGKFSEYEYFSIAIGEESNELTGVLEQLILYFQDQIALRKQIISVMSYPIFVIAITFGLVYFMMTNIIPIFVDVFQQFGSELPSLTQTVVSISENFGTYALILLIAIAGIALFVRFQKHKIWFRKYTSAFFLRIPQVGQLIKLVYLSRFTQSMQLLLASNTPLVRAIELTEKMIKYYPIEVALNKVKKDISEGKTLHEGMQEFKFFPKRMLSLVKVGEEVNQLDVMLAKVSNQYREEMKHRTAILGKLMEPILLLLVAGIVGVILIAMYLPMFNLSNVLGQ